MATRRTLLAAAAAAGAAAGVGFPLTTAPAQAAPTDEPDVPQTLARRRDHAGASAQTAETPFPLTHLAVGWSGPGEAGVRVRSRDGWKGWQAAHSCHGGRDGRPDTRRWALLTVPGAVGYEIAPKGDIGSVSILELNTVDGPRIAKAAPEADMVSLHQRSAPIKYRSRACWGADESVRFGNDGAETWPPEYFPVQTLTVHHTAGMNKDPDPAATMRAIYYSDAVTRGWGDFGYHLAIDEAGTVYEGRYSGSDHAPVFGPDLGADGRPQMVNGAHVTGFNAGNIGVVLLGDFTSQLPTPAARRSLAVLLATLAGVTRLDPTGTTHYVNPISGSTATVRTICGHRDWAPTECPGNLYYPKLPALRTEVASLLRYA